MTSCFVCRLHPLPDGKCSHAAKDLATFATEFATQIGGFYVGSASLRGGGTKSDGDIAREAAGKCRKCVETLAVEFPKRTSARPGFKESHAMQLVKDSEYLNNVAGTFERSAARAAVGEDGRRYVRRQRARVPRTRLASLLRAGEGRDDVAD